MRIRMAALALALAITWGLSAQLAGAQENKVQDPAQSKEFNTEAYIQLLRSNLAAKKEAIVKETMQLNDQQAAVFWPIYREY